MRADEIVVAPAQLVLPVVAHAHHPRERPARELALPRPARVAAAVVAIQIDHATGARHRRLGADGDREELQNVAMAVVAEQPDGLRVAQLRVVDEPALLLFEALARIELHGDGRRSGRGPHRTARA